MPTKSPSGTANGAIAITPNDVTLLLNEGIIALNVAVSGNVEITDLYDNDVVLYIAAGVAFPIAVKRVKATLTTATGIVGLYR